MISWREEILKIRFSMFACARSAERDSVLVQIRKPSETLSYCIYSTVQSTLLNWSKIIADWTIGLNWQSFR